MSFENNICPYIRDCNKFLKGSCLIFRKFQEFRECGNYKDSEEESSGVNLEDKANYIVEQLKKSDKTEKIIEKKSEKCPYRLNCYVIFEKGCDDLYDECDGMCDDCHLRNPDYGVYCDSVEHEKCEAYEIISILKEEYESMGIHSTKDLKDYYGEDFYERLGGFIRCAFLMPEDISNGQRLMDDYL